MKIFERATVVTAVALGSLGALGLGLAGVAQAQTVARGFALDRFLPSPSGSDWFSGDSLRIEDNLRPVVGVSADYDVDPLVLYNADGSRRATPVKGQFFLRAGASLSMWGRYRAAIDLPISPYQAGETGIYNGESITGAQSGGIGDLSLAMDVRLLGRYGQPLTMGAGVQVFLPTGDRDRFLGEGTVRVMPRVAAAGMLSMFMYSAQVGLMLRDQHAFAGVQRGSDLTFAAAAGVALLDRRLVVGPELYGATGVGKWAGDGAFKQFPAEAMLGAHFRVTPEWRLGATGAIGVSKGLGTPAERVLLSMDWSPRFVERDHTPATIVVAPPPPTPLPAAPVAVLPPADRDGDLVNDDVDACADVPGVATTDPKTNGCPAVLADSDGDGIPDPTDACPNVAGVASDVRLLNGCPPTPAGPPVAEKIFFAPGLAELNAASLGVLGRLAVRLKAAPQLKLTVDGHADDQGKDAFNKDLSHKRATAATDWLIAHGVPTQQLEARWFGNERLAHPEHDATSRRANRRVELNEQSPLTSR